MHVSVLCVASNGQFKGRMSVWWNPIRYINMCLTTTQTMTAFCIFCRLLGVARTVQRSSDVYAIRCDSDVSRHSHDVKVDRMIRLRKMCDYVNYSWLCGDYCGRFSRRRSTKAHLPKELLLQAIECFIYLYICIMNLKKCIHSKQQAEKLRIMPCILIQWSPSIFYCIQSILIM